MTPSSVSVLIVSSCASSLAKPDSHIQCILGMCDCPSKSMPSLNTAQRTTADRDFTAP
jgi:hypothetical protein